MKIRNKKKDIKNGGSQYKYLEDQYKFKEELMRRQLDYYDNFDEMLKVNGVNSAVEEAYNKNRKKLRQDGFLLLLDAEKFDIETEIFRNEIRLRNAEQFPVIFLTTLSVIVSFISILIGQIDDFKTYLPILFWFTAMLLILVLYFFKNYQIKNNINKKIIALLNQRRSLELKLLCVNEFKIVENNNKDI